MKTNAYRLAILWTGLVASIAVNLGAQAANSLADRLIQAATTDARRAVLADVPKPARDEALADLMARGKAAGKLFDHPVAIRTLEAARDTADFGGDVAQIAQAYRAYGAAEYRAAHYAPALDAFRVTIDASRKAGDRVIEANGFRGIGNVEFGLGHGQAAYEASQSAAAIFQSLGQTDEYAGELANSAANLAMMGQYQRAADMYNQAIRIALPINDLGDVAGALMGLAMVYVQQGDYEVALADMEKLTLPDNYGDIDPRDDTYFHVIYATVLGKLHRYDEALAHIAKGLVSAKKADAKPRTAWLLMERAALRTDVGKIREALADETEAVAITRQTGNSMTLAYTLGQMVPTRIALGETAEALRASQECVDRATETGSPEAMAMALEALGLAQRASGLKEQAADSFRRSIRERESWRSEKAGGASEGQDFFGKRLEAYHGLMELELEAGHFEEALAVAERTKARRLLDIAGQGSVDPLANLSDADRAKEKDLCDAAARANAEYQASPTGAKRAVFEKAARELDAFHAYHFYSRGPASNSSPVEATALNYNELLPDTKTMLLEYVVGDNETYLFTVERGVSASKPKLASFRLKVGSKDLERRITALRADLAGRDLGYRPVAHELYRDLLGPAERQLAGKTLVGISPDGALWNLPFETLLDASEHHLIERTAIFYPPSLTALASDLHRGSARAVPTGTLLAIGAATNDLSATSADLSLLARVYPTGSNVLASDVATEAAFKRQAPQYRILHAGTHGVLNRVNPMYSYLTLRPGDGDDGMLEARELASMSLAADLAVLSACDTARGEIREGEGVLGLGWAVLSAGASSTVVSQWKVDEKSTSELMLAFHKAIERGLTPSHIRGKAEALRQASLGVMRNPAYKHPFYWAPFVLLGDGY